MISLLVIVCIVTLNLPVSNLAGGYPVTLAALSEALYLLYAFKNCPKQPWLVCCLFAIFFVVNAVCDIEMVEGYKFFRSLLLTTSMLLVYTTSFFPINRLRSLLNFKNILKWTSILILGYQFLQISEQLIFNTTTSWLWLHGISTATGSEISRYEAVNMIGLYRPISFYYEPSYLASVVFTCLIVNDATCGRKWIRYSLSLSIFCTLSMTMIPFLVLYYFYNIFYTRNQYSFLAATILGIFLFFCWDSVASFSRIGEVFEYGTSGYIRIYEPALETLHSLIRHPFGSPLGQNNIIFHCSLFLLIIYFGTISPFVIFTWYRTLAAKISNKNLIFKYCLCVLALGTVNGSFFTLETAFLLAVLNYSTMGSKTL